MKEITLEWQEFGRTKIYTIYDQQPSKNPGTVRIGRNPAECDIVLNEPTVSGLHVEIFFNTFTQTFVLRNLRYSNPPVVDDRQVVAQVVTIHSGSIIYLGQLELRVVGVSLHQSSNGIPQTVLLPPQPSATVPPSVPAGIAYGLECPKCHRVSPYERMEWGCQWCGTSLAAASSVLISPNL